MRRSPKVCKCYTLAWFLLQMSVLQVTAMQVTVLHAQENRQTASVESWMRESAVPFKDTTNSLGSMDAALRPARVIAIGEATHGQHEVFEAKLQLTMQLIRTNGIRLVAYEASASKMLDANDYVSGKADDVQRAMAGFGMLIWQIEENRALLEQLREWNRQASAQDQVRLVGIDAQDSQAAMSRLILLVGEWHSETVAQMKELVSRVPKVIATMMTGDRQPWDEIAKEIESLRTVLRNDITVNADNAAQYELRVCEFLYSLSIFSTRGGRDEAMAQLLLKQLEQTGIDSRCVVWAHNAHIQRSPLGYLGSPELAMGGHLAKRLGNRYYALGVAFGEGEFQANAPAPDGSWGFRRYRLSAAPEGSLDWMLGKAGLERYLLDLRGAPKSTAVQQWLSSPHGQRWFGGYSVPDDCESVTRDASKLMPTTPREDFDGLLYVAKTTAAKPRNAKLILENKQSEKAVP